MVASKGQAALAPAPCTRSAARGRPSAAAGRRRQPVLPAARQSGVAYCIGWISAALQAAVGCRRAPQRREPLSQFVRRVRSPPPSLNFACSRLRRRDCATHTERGALCPASGVFAQLATCLPLVAQDLASPHALHPVHPLLGLAVVPIGVRAARFSGMLECWRAEGLAPARGAHADHELMNG